MAYRASDAWGQVTGSSLTHCAAEYGSWQATHAHLSLQAVFLVCSRRVAMLCAVVAVTVWLWRRTEIRHRLGGISISIIRLWRQK